MNNNINRDRLSQHIEFIKRYKKEVKDVKYISVFYEFPVITKQEIDILLYSIKKYSAKDNKFILNHQKFDFAL